MPRKIRQLKADLRKAGFLLIPKRGRGSHTPWVHPQTRASVTVSGSDDADAQYYQESDVRETIAESMKPSHHEGE